MIELFSVTKLPLLGKYHFLHGGDVVFLPPKQSFEDSKLLISPLCECMCYSIQTHTFTIL